MIENRRYFLLLGIILIFSDVLSAQSLSVLWQKSFGGSLNEFTGRGRQSLQTFDGGFILAGQTESNDSNTGVNKGGLDFWIIKSNAEGNILWQKNYGGNNLEYASSIQQTSDSGYVVSGYTNSNNNADVGLNHGGYDAWIIRLDKSGNMIWQKILGGNADDYADAILQTVDGGFIIAGNTLSNNSGDVSLNHGLADSWIIRLDSAGTISWQENLGGDKNDIAYDIAPLLQGGFIIAGYSETNNNGDVGINHGKADFWLIRINDAGNILWEKTYGGNQEDVAYSIQQKSDYSFIVAGFTKSDNVDDVPANHGETDAWILNLDSAGSLIWDKTYGGNMEDVASSIGVFDDGTYLFAGYTLSNSSGDIGINNGDADGWMVKLDKDGLVLWSHTEGGNSKDIITGFAITNTNGIIVAGDTYSENSAAGINNHGFSDYWMMRMEGPASITDSVSSVAYCRGDTIHIPYVTKGYFAVNNIFTVQLSDTAGNFSFPVSLGILNSSNTGNIDVILPDSILPGSGYKIRLVSSNPSLISDGIDTTFTINSCIVSLDLKMFIQGFYLGNGLMQPVLLNSYLSIDSTECDSILIELHDALNPATILYSENIILHTDGTAEFNLPVSFYGATCYIVVRHRNSIETWSKNPYTFLGNSVSCDFSAY